MRVGIVTSVPEDFGLLAPVADIPSVRVPSEEPTAFENVYNPAGTRRQSVLSRARPLTLGDVPDAWRRAPIIHLGPLVDEIGPDLATGFPASSLLGVTLQGWLRTWDESGIVRPRAWNDPDGVLQSASAVVMSIEDVAFDEERANAYAAQTQILVVTRGERGCSVHWREGWRQFDAPEVPLVDPTGSGDPTKATAEKGRRMIEAAVDRLATTLKELSDAPMDDLFPYRD